MLSYFILYLPNVINKQSERNKFVVVVVVSHRLYRLLCQTFFCMCDTTYFLGRNFLCFPPDRSTQHKGSLECQSVSLSVSLGEAIYD